MIIGSRKWDIPILIAGAIGLITLGHFWFATGLSWWIRFPVDVIYGAFVGWHATTPVRKL